MAIRKPNDFDGLDDGDELWNIMTCAYRHALSKKMNFNADGQAMGPLSDPIMLMDMLARSLILRCPYANLLLLHVR